MERRLVLIGFGEAAQAFAGDIAAECVAYDRKTDAFETRAGKVSEAAALHVGLAESNSVAVAGAPLILSLVTARQALAAAEETARTIAPGALFCDMNSVAPETKRAAARAIEGAGARYVDVGVMGPVHPERLAVPLLAGGPHGEAAAEALRSLGFDNVRALGGAVGSASAIKMIRSVMVKGIEALTAECLLAAESAGVRNEIVASLDASWPETDWSARGDYNLDRMMVHGLRRADELEEVVTMLEALGTGATMSRATAECQRAIGRFRVAPPEGLARKLSVLLPLLSSSTIERTV